LAPSKKGKPELSYPILESAGHASGHYWITLSSAFIPKYSNKVFDKLLNKTNRYSLKGCGAADKKQLD